MAKRFFEEYQKGEVIHSRSRLIEACDIRGFAGCTSLAGRLFTDALYCAEFEEIQKPIVPSSLLLNILDTFFAIDVTPSEVPKLHYGYGKVRFLKPLYPGDSVYSIYTLADTKVKNDDFGVLTWHVNTYNQDDELVCFHEDLVYVGRLK